MNSLTYKVPNISCDHCINTIKLEVGDIEGVNNVDGTADEQTVMIEYGDPATEEKIVAVMTDIYYPPQA